MFDRIAHTLAALARAFFRIEMFLLLGCQRNRRGSYQAQIISRRRDQSGMNDG
jgi:hypothetical protein